MIWRETLGLKATKRSLNLLDMGIGARRLMKLLNAIEDATGAVIAPTAALQLGTFEAFANAVREGGRPSRTPLILLKSADGGHGPPLYLISGGGGFILEQVEMAQAIVHDGPIYGLQLPGLDGSEEALGSIEAMAAYYLDYINLAHPGGAYHVVGYSFGGLVALEIARLLQTSGAHIGLIGLLESNVHERRWPLAAWLQYLMRRAIIHGQALLEMPLGSAIVELANCLGSSAGKIVRRLLPAPTQAQPSMARKSVFYIGGLPPSLQRVRDQSIGAFETYAPAPIDVPVTLIKSRSGEPHFCDPVLVWRRIVRDLDIAVVPGAHKTMLRPPYCGMLASELSKRLEKA
jgi:thioesterase domain-containing protein